MLISSLPYKFVQPWASGASGAYLTFPIPSTAAGGAASQNQGFPQITSTEIAAGGIPPSISDFNGVLFYLSIWTRWQQAGAPVFYDSAFSTAIGGYPKGSILDSTTFGRKWQSQVDNNTTDPDGGSPANWLNISAVGGDLTGTLPNPTIKYNVNLLGAPTTATPATNDSSSKIATTAFVNPGGSLTRPGYRTNADGTVDQWWTTAVSGGGGLVSTVVPLPIAFVHDLLDVQVCFDGTTPPGAVNPGSIAVQYLNAASVTVTTNYPSTATLGIRLRALGY